MIVQGPSCTACGSKHEVELTDEEFFAWMRADHIQDALPDTAPEVREILISGVGPECWKKLFGAEED